MPRGRPSIDPIVRFHSKYEIDEETGCFNWTGDFFNGGYPRISIDKKGRLAHRFAYESFVAPLDSSLEICHNCNNKKCVNPDHLRQDTKSSNQIDISKIKGRKNQKLSIIEVTEIKLALKNSYYGIQKDLSKKYNISQQTLNDIKQNRLWSHIKV